MNNRPLKFRAWDRATSRMYPEFHLFGETACFDLLTQWLMEFPLGKTSLERMNDVEVMQFTGLKDSAGKDIFEGDILEEEVCNGSMRALGVCKQVLGGWKIFSHPNSSICWHGWGQKIIGNIFQHPHLLAE